MRQEAWSPFRVARGYNSVFSFPTFSIVLHPPTFPHARSQRRPSHNRLQRPALRGVWSNLRRRYRHLLDTERSGQGTCARVPVKPFHFQSIERSSQEGLSGMRNGQVLTIPSTSDLRDLVEGPAWVAPARCPQGFRLLHGRARHETSSGKAFTSVWIRRRCQHRRHDTSSFHLLKDATDWYAALSTNEISYAARD